jgi:hypothetical protein
MILLIFTSIFPIINTSAQEAIDNKINATILIEFINATNFDIHITLNAMQITTDQVYNANQIQSASEQEIGAFRLALYLELKEQLEQVFPNAQFFNFTMPVFNVNTFTEELRLKLPSTFFNLNENVNADNLINGALDIGAEILYNFDFKAKAGWNNTYTIILPSSMTPPYTPYTNGIINGDRISWKVLNGIGEQPEVSGEMSTQFISPTTPRLSSENIKLEFQLDASNEKQTILIANILAEAIDIRDYDIFTGAIIGLNYIPSDGIRLLIENELFTWDDFYEYTIKEIETNIKSTIENSSYNKTLDLTFIWDIESTINCSNPYNITNMDANPIAKVELIDNTINLKICDQTTRAIFGLVNTGAEINITNDNINFGENIDELDYEYNGSVYLPSNIFLDGKNIYEWDENTPISGIFESSISPKYSSELIEVFVEIDMSTTDLNLLSFFTGNTELSVAVSLQETKNYSVMNLPDEFILPEKISIEYMNSDAFRLCIEENVFNQGNVSEFLDNERKLFVNRITGILSGLDIEGYTNNDLFQESVGSWDGNISKMDAEIPIRVSSYSNSNYPIKFDLGFILPKFEIPSQNYTFNGIANQNITYRMIFPHGITVEYNDSLGKSILGKTDDGRDYIQISYNSTESDLSNYVICKLVPSVFFIIGILMPCILSLIVTIILVIIILMIRKRRKGKKGMSIAEEYDEEESNGYEDKDYYIPPPPSS